MSIWTELIRRIKMTNRNPERFDFEDGRKSHEIIYEFIKISDAELRHFEKAESLVLKWITPMWTLLHECFLFAEFTRTPACGDAVLGNLGKFAWEYVDVRLHNNIKRSGRLSVPLVFDSNDAENPGYRGELSEWGRLTYMDLVQGIHIRIINTDWTDWLTNRTGDRVDGIV